jgi:hypothetical protein
MKTYFESKIGQSILKPYTTGKTFFTEVYKRVFRIEIITVSATKIQAKVRKSDYVPSGYGEGGTEFEYPARNFSYKKTESIDQITDRICRTVNPEFFNRYKF